MFDIARIYFACGNGTRQENRKFALALAKILLERGASVTTRDGDGRTCLHAAVLGGFLPCIRLALSQKVSHAVARSAALAD